MKILQVLTISTNSCSKLIRLFTSIDCLPWSNHKSYCNSRDCRLKSFLWWLVATSAQPQSPCTLLISCTPVLIAASHPRLASKATKPRICEQHETLMSWLQYLLWRSNNSTNADILWQPQHERKRTFHLSLFISNFKRHWCHCKKAISTTQTSAENNPRSTLYTLMLEKTALLLLFASF